MKIKSDFVTNSSSSSFVIFLDKIPESIIELQKIMFGDDKYFDAQSWCDENLKYETYKIAETIFKDITNSTPNNLIELYNSMDTDVDYKGFTIGKDSHGYEDYDWDTFGIHVMVSKYEQVQKILKDKKDKVFYILSYDDHSDYNAMIESGRVFHKLDYIKYYHH